MGPKVCKQPLSRFCITLSFSMKCGNNHQVLPLTCSHRKIPISLEIVNMYLVLAHMGTLCMCVWLCVCVSGAGRLRPFMLIKVSHWRVAGKKAGSDWPSRTHLYADSPRSHEWLSINLFHKLSGVVTARLGRTEAKKCGFVDARFRRSDGRSFVDTTLAGSCFGRRLSLCALRGRERKRERVSVCVREPVCACLCVCACVCVYA